MLRHVQACTTAMGGPLGPDGARAAVRADHRRGAAARAESAGRHDEREADVLGGTRAAERSPDRAPSARAAHDGIGGSELEDGSMVVVMEERATEEQIEKVIAQLVEMGIDVHRSTGVTRTVLGAVGDDGRSTRA